MTYHQSAIAQRRTLRMKLQSTLATVALILPTLSLAAFWESPFLKSLGEAQQECAEYQRLSNETVERYSRNGYPDDSCARDFVFCIVFTLNAWDLESGIRDHVISQFFKPSHTDSKYEDRTQDCLRETVDCLPKHDQKGRAYKSFLCYYRNYGNVVQERKYVPYFDSTRELYYRDSIIVKSVPRDVLQQYAAGDILNSEQFAEVYYTYVLGSGYYDPEVGVNLERTYVQFGNPEILSESTRCCEASVRRQYQEEPKRLAETFKQCFQHLLPSLETIKKVSKQLLEETPENVLPLPSSPSCSKCGSPAPCKTCGITEIPRFNVYRPCYNGQCY